MYPIIYYIIKCAFVYKHVSTVECRFMTTQSISLANLLANTTYEPTEPFFMLDNEPQYEWTPNDMNQRTNHPPDKSTEYFKTDKYTFQAKIHE